VFSDGGLTADLCKGGFRSPNVPCRLGIVTGSCVLAAILQALLSAATELQSEACGLAGLALLSALYLTLTPFSQTLRTAAAELQSEACGLAGLALLSAYTIQCRHSRTPFL